MPAQGIFQVAYAVTDGIANLDQTAFEGHGSNAGFRMEPLIETFFVMLLPTFVGAGNQVRFFKSPVMTEKSIIDRESQMERFDDF